MRIEVIFILVRPSDWSSIESLAAYKSYYKVELGPEKPQRWH